MSRSEWFLALLLRLGGAITLLAFLAVFLPTAWMAETHAWLGLGDFPASPLVDYLTRSVSMLYAVYGGLMLLVSFNLRRFRPIILFVAITHVALGVALFFIDLHAELPALWIALEGPPVVVFGALLWWLTLRVPKD